MVGILPLMLAAAAVLLYVQMRRGLSLGAAMLAILTLPPYPI